MEPLVLANPQSVPVLVKNSWIYINTGALYRGIGYTAHKLKIDSNNPKQLEEVLDHFNKNYSWDHKTLTLSYQGENISPFLIAEEVGSMASKLASKSIVRENFFPYKESLSTPIVGILFLWMEETLALLFALMLHLRFLCQLLLKQGLLEE